MVFDLKRLKDVLQREVVEPMDHRFLNREVPPFDRGADHGEPGHRGLAAHRAAPGAARGCASTACGSTRPRTCTSTISEAAVIRLTRRYRFSASHRLHAAGLSDAENRELYGKCNNPHGHGHDYVLEVSVRGPVDAESGRVGGRGRRWTRWCGEQVLGRSTIAT
jgi:6-pyruvoyltetrahydropterin/6-carboxytetrahydropterin synthase